MLPRSRLCFSCADSELTSCWGAVSSGGLSPLLSLLDNGTECEEICESCDCSTESFVLSIIGVSLLETVSVLRGKVPVFCEVFINSSA